MKLSIFLEDIKKNQEEVVYYCCNHLLSKKFDINNDSVDVSLSDNNRLSIIIDRDLDYKQTFEVFINSNIDGLYNKKMDIFINHKSNDNDLLIKTLLISNIELPISYNQNVQIDNISKRIDNFDYRISDNIDNIEILNSSTIRLKIDTSSPLLLKNTVLPGDILLIQDFIIISKIGGNAGNY